MRKFYAAAFLAMLAVPSLAADAKVEYPYGYRNWHHVKSMVILPGDPLADPFAGIHHIYANPKAIAGLKSARYDDGATFVFDLLEGAAADNAVQEGKRKFIGVMYRDANRFAATGGWGFEAFAGDSKSKRVVTDGGQSCFSCHSGQQDKGYVFTTTRR